MRFSPNPPCAGGYRWLAGAVPDTDTSGGKSTDAYHRRTPRAQKEQPTVTESDRSRRERNLGLVVILVLVLVLETAVIGYLVTSN